MAPPPYSPSPRQLLPSDPPLKFPSLGRPRTFSNVTKNLLINIFLARLKRRLTAYRRKKAAHKSPHPHSKAPTPGLQRIKPVTRTNSGFMPNKKRNMLLQEYASSIVHPTDKVANKPMSKRTETPSPDFYYMHNLHSRPASPPRRPIRRSSSMQSLNGHTKTLSKPSKQTQERFECWKVGIGYTAIGLKTQPIFTAYKRGQSALQKMAAAFKEADDCAGRTVDSKDSRVKLLLKERNKSEKKKGSGRQWSLVAGQVLKRDPGRSGAVTAEKIVVILVRR